MPSGLRRRRTAPDRHATPAVDGERHPVPNVPAAFKPKPGQLGYQIQLGRPHVPEVQPTVAVLPSGRCVSCGVACWVTGSKVAAIIGDLLALRGVVDQQGQLTGVVAVEDFDVDPAV
jgi:hypothetical protein